MMVEVNPIIREVLAPLSLFYGDPTTVECRMNKPGEVITDRRGKGLERHSANDLTQALIESLCRSLANHHGIAFHIDNNPKLSCILPDGSHRFECLVGASVQSGLSLAIRCKHPFKPSWSKAGVNQTIKAYLMNALNQEANMIISGATNTGKTTFLNMLLAQLPADRRVIALEDTPELEIERFWNGNGLIAAREEKTNQGSGMVSWRELYDHMMRITPDHIIFGEISTTNCLAALGALNSGVTGFFCTIHSESPIQAITRKFDQNISWSGQTMPRVPEFLSELVDVVVQIKRDRKGNRKGYGYL